MHPRLGSLLGRWHQWRSHYSHERGYSRVQFMAPAWGDEDDDAELERMLMRAIEDAISTMHPLCQLALQHAARSECLGVEVVRLNRLPADPVERDLIVAQAEQLLERKLIAAGLL